MSAPENNHGHQLKRIVLPSGKTIEVVYFPGGDEAELTAAERAAAEQVAETEQQQQVGVPAEDLHLCRDCDSDLVYPVEWEEAGPEHWQVDLRCPNCEWVCTGVFSQDVVEDFDEELDRGTEVLTEDYKRMVTANMAEDIERFSKALEADAILPEDF
jgi:hypothetical protein